jgi:DNA polymerase III subunit epsilon
MTKPFHYLNLARPLVLTDVETTGVLPRRDRVIEVAAVKYLPSGERLRFHRRVRPGVAISASATAIHGITDEDVAGCPPFEAIAPSLARFLRDCDLAGFNLKRFDLPFLVAEFARAGIHFPLSRRAVIDVLEIYHQREPRDLSAAVSHYLGRDHNGAHRALADAYATAAVLDAQLKTYRDLPRDVPELHRHFADADLARKLRRDENDRLVFAFGKYTSVPVDEIAHSDSEYLRWLLTQD